MVLVRWSWVQSSAWQREGEGKRRSKVVEEVPRARAGADLKM